MQDWNFDGQLVRTLKISGFILVFLCLVLALRPKDPVILGFVVGTATGMWNAFFLARRLRAVVNTVLPKAKAQMKAGFAIRLTTVIVVLFFVAWTGVANLLATAAGLFVAPLVFTFDAARMCSRILIRKPGRPNPLNNKN